MIQIIGVRAENGKHVDAFTDRGWCPSGIFDIFTKLDDILSVIPLEERFDLFFTTHHVTPGRHREFASCDSLTFEVDKLKHFDGSLAQAMRVSSILSDIVSIDVDQISIFQSGKSSIVLAMPLQKNNLITDIASMGERLADYKELCFDFEFQLRQEGIQGRVNKKAWGLGTLLRLPGTEVTEEGKSWEKDSSAKLSIVQ